MRATVGTCSLCGGRVTVPDVWMSIIPPTPTCEQCGAVAAEHGPVIPMRPAQPVRISTGTSLGGLVHGDAEFAVTVDSRGEVVS